MNFHTSLTLAQKVALHNEIVAVIHDVCPRVCEIVERYKAFKILTKTGEPAAKGKLMMEEFNKLAAYYKTNGEFFRTALFWISNYGTLMFLIEIHRKGDRLAASCDFSLSYLKDGGFQLSEIVLPWVKEPEKHFARVNLAELERLLSKRDGLKKELEGVESQIPHSFR